MKTLFSSIILMAIFSTAIFGQSITNTLGTNGVFYIKDANNNFFTLTQSTGEVNILKGLRLELTANNPTTGVIFKGIDRFIHDYKALGTVGHNTFVGVNSGNFTMAFSSNSVEASNNTGIGYNSLSGLTTGNFNTASGYNSLIANTTGFSNTASGAYSLASNTSGQENTASGYNSLSSNTIGIQNTATGGYSLRLNTSGSVNTALGYYALSSNTTGSYNTGTGESSLFSNTTGRYNTASGFYSLYSNITGDFNTASGDYSLYTNTIGNRNTSSGYFSLALNVNGNENTALGYSSLSNNTSGFSNTALGNGAGSIITTGSNLLCIGNNAQPSLSNAQNEITLGDGGITALRCNVLFLSSLSDARDKKNVQDLQLGIDFLMKLKPRQFNWDKREWYENNTSDGSKIQNTPTAGFIAQELDSVQMGENAEWLKLVLKENPNRFEATPGNLLPIMVKAIQDLKKENDEIKTENTMLNDRLTKFEKMQTILVSEIEKLKANNTISTEVSLGNK